MAVLHVLRRVRAFRFFRSEILTPSVSIDSLIHSICPPVHALHLSRLIWALGGCKTQTTEAGKVISESNEADVETGEFCPTSRASPVPRDAAVSYTHLTLPTSSYV